MLVGGGVRVDQLAAVHIRFAKRKLADRIAIVTLQRRGGKRSPRPREARLQVSLSDGLRLVLLSSGSSVTPLASPPLHAAAR
jgi:hypothetical protein